MLRFLLHILVGPPRKQNRRRRPPPPGQFHRPDRSSKKWTHDPNDSPHLINLREIRGKAHIIDGDTIVIQRIKIRLAGVDAPELDQPWGQKSKWEMVNICKGKVITAKLTGEVSHDRLVGTCYLPDGRDIGAELIKRGLALDFTNFSGGKYRHLEPPGVRRKLKGIHRYY